MLVAFSQGASASTVSPASSPTSSSAISVLSSGASGPSSGPRPPREQVRHMLFGTLGTVQTTIALLHTLGYAEPNDWSRPISTGRPNEVLAILTKRVSAV
ncbi:MAG: hypothetical protein WA783_14670 [Phormidesmis sp.]